MKTVPLEWLTEPQTFADLVKESCLRQAMTYHMLAERAGVSHSAIFNILYLRKRPTGLIIAKIAEACGLIEWVETQEPALTLAQVAYLLDNRKALPPWRYKLAGILAVLSIPAALLGYVADVLGVWDFLRG